MDQSGQVQWGELHGDQVPREPLTEQVTFGQDSWDVSEQAPWLAGQWARWRVSKRRGPRSECCRCVGEEWGAGD